MSFGHLNHFSAMLIFAALASVAVGSLARRTAANRIRYALWTFALFLIVSIGIAWIMYPFSR
jgi:cell division septal protein FtsQ